MSKPSNKTLIGIFVLGAITLLVIAIVVLGSGKFFRKTFKAVCFFEGSVRGLSVGVPVVFNGVRVGSVTEIVLRYDMRHQSATIPVYIEIDPQTMKTIGPRLPKSFEENLKLLIDYGLRAQLEVQSIVTGRFQVALGFHPDEPVRLVGADQRYPEIPTIPSSTQEIEGIIKNIATAVEEIKRVVNSPEITKTIQSVSLAAEEAKGLIQNLNSQVQPVSSDVQQTLREAQKLLRGIDVKATTLTSSVDGAVKDVQKLAQNVDGQVGPLGRSIQRTLGSIEKTSDEARMTFRQAQQTLAVLKSDIGEDSALMYEIKKAVKQVGTSGRAIQNLAEVLEQQPESLLYGKQKKAGR